MTWRVAPGHELGRRALPCHEAVVGLTVVVEAMRGVAVAAQPDLRRDAGRPDHHDLVLVGEHLVEAGGLVVVLAHERHPLLDDRGEEVELRARADGEHLVHEQGALDARLLELLGAGAPGHAAAQPVEPAGAPLGGLVPPVAVERLAPFEVHAVDVRRPPGPTPRADVPDVDHLRPAPAARRTHVERALEPEHLGHPQHRVLPEVLHVLVLALADDVDGLVEVQAARRHRGAT